MNSISQAYSNYLLSLGRFSKFAIAFFATLIAFPILFLISYIYRFPHLSQGFWSAIIITSILNFIATPIMLKAYETGEFSSVYSMILLTPVFLLLTSFIFLGERPTIFGATGVMLTIIGLGIIETNTKKEGERFHLFRGTGLGVIVALIYSISTNFDKLSAQHSDAFFAPAVGAAILALFNGIYLIARKKDKIGSDKLTISNFLFLIPMGLLWALVQVLHNAALLHGLVSYTIAIKRTGILFGVVWGWLFFREKGIGKKLLGAAVAVGGVVLILIA